MSNPPAAPLLLDSVVPPERADQGGYAAPPVPSSQLLQGARIVEISHNGVIYRLQATRLGKLILTK